MRRLCFALEIRHVNWVKLLLPWGSTQGCPARTMVMHRRVPKRWKFPALRRRALGYTCVWSRMMLRGVRAAMSTSLLNTGVACAREDAESRRAQVHSVYIVV